MTVAEVPKVPGPGCVQGAAERDGGEPGGRGARGHGAAGGRAGDAGQDAGLLPGARALRALRVPCTLPLLPRMLLQPCQGAWPASWTLCSVHVQRMCQGVFQEECLSLPCVV